MVNRTMRVGASPRRFSLAPAALMGSKSAMERFGRYVLGEELGVGGGGRVLRADLVGPGGATRQVALKLMEAGGPDLRREARIGGL